MLIAGPGLYASTAPNIATQASIADTQTPMVSISGLQYHSKSLHTRKSLLSWQFLQHLPHLQNHLFLPRAWRLARRF